MQLTKFTHACVRLEDGDRRLVIDPGSFSEVEPALEGVDAVLITHEHADHVQPETFLPAAQANSALRVWAPSSLADALSDLGDRLTIVEPGQQFTAGGFDVQTVGGQHALIHPSIATIANIGYIVDGAVYHPGDSFFVPSQPVSTLLLPLHAPWSKTAEVIDFAISVRAPKAIPVHDWLLNPTAKQMVVGMINGVAGPHGVEAQLLTPVETVGL